MKKPGALIYYSILPAVEILSMEERGQLLTAILQYGRTKDTIQFEGQLNVAWAFIKPMLDQDTAHYDSVCATKRKAANTRWEKEKSKEDAYASNSMHMHASDANSNCNSNTNINTMQHTKSVSWEKLVGLCKKHNIPESFGKSFYERYSASGWTDQNGKAIRSIQKLLLRAWEDERSKTEPGSGTDLQIIRERQQTDRENSCTPDELVEYPPGSGRYMPRAELETKKNG